MTPLRRVREGGEDVGCRHHWGPEADPRLCPHRVGQGLWGGPAAKPLGVADRRLDGQTICVFSDGDRYLRGVAIVHSSVTGSTGDRESLRASKELRGPDPVLGGSGLADTSGLRTLLARRHIYSQWTVS